MDPVKYEAVKLLTCFHCFRIFLKPCQLPCGHIICHEHLTTKHVYCTDEFQCRKCKFIFKVNGNKLIFPALELQQALDKQIHLTSFEKNFKISLENDFKSLEVAYQKFLDTKPILEAEIYEHFSELRRKIDIQREVGSDLKTFDQSIVDDISIDMIVQTKISEKETLNGLTRKYEIVANMIFPNGKEIELDSLEETFRELFIGSSLKILKNTFLKKINKLQYYFQDISQVIIVLKQRNKFYPTKYGSNNLNPFGIVSLERFWLNPFRSKILNYKYSYDLIKICNFNVRGSWTLIYRGSRDGFSTESFHDMCDGKTKTLTIMKTGQRPFIFGGYTNASWSSENTTVRRGFAYDDGAFIFSLENYHNIQCKMTSEDSKSSIICSKKLGPSFGRGDIKIFSEGLECTSFIGNTYAHPWGKCFDKSEDESHSFLAGSHKFKLSEIEVFQFEPF